MTEKQYIALFNQHKKEIEQNSTHGINNQRDEALKAFQKNGFPTSKLEDYKHSDLSRVFDVDYKLILRSNYSQLAKCEPVDFNNRNVLSNDFLFINGQYYEDKLPQIDIPKNVFVGSLQKFSETNPTQFKKYYAQIADMQNNGVVAFNTMFVQDGFVVYVPQNTKIDVPLQLTNLVNCNENAIINNRILIIAEQNAQLKIFSCTHSEGKAKTLSIQVVEIYMDNSAKVEYHELESNTLQTTKISYLFSKQNENSNITSSNFTLNNGFTRNNFQFDLLGENTETHVGGLAICDQNQHVDNFVFINHDSPKCLSNQLFKYILQEDAVGSFCGKILVAKDAQKTQAFQSNKNICVSDGARMFSKPQLEIYADDVKCSHGLTTGQIDEDALFYMQARGISLEQSRMLLMLAFTQDVIELIGIDDIKDNLINQIGKRCAIN